MRKLLAICSLLWALGAAAITPKDIAVQLQNNPQIHGDFTQLRYLRGMSEPLESSGNFAISAEQGLWWAPQKPFVALLKVSPRGVLQWQNGRWQDMSQQAGNTQVRLFLSLLGGDWDELESGFTLEAQGDIDGWTLTLIPKYSTLQQVLEKIVVRGDQIIREIDISEAQGDRSELHFSDVTRGLPDDPRMRP
ncbi:outer membrane lipoprotein carrier protein LolA [Cardiobacteriaceae bacterium TAE3-ERU3]|nr:outer membrane lipoprotein carrier protein LolA [Cardiobacteriaceae bacterium TAE3-ERU3]